MSHELLGIIIAVVSSMGASVVTIKISLATIIANIKNSVEKAVELKEDVKEIEKRVRAVEAHDKGTEAYVEVLLASIKELKDKIDAWNN